MKNTNYYPDMKFWSLVFVFFALVMDAVHFFIFGQFFTELIFGTHNSWSNLLINASGVFANATLFIILAGWNPFSKREWFFLGGAGLVLAIYLNFLNPPDDWSAMPLLRSLLLPASYYTLLHALLFWLRSCADKNQPLPMWVPRFFCISLMVLGLIVVPRCTLHITPVLLPLTYDVHLYKVDAAFLGVAQSAAQIARGSSWLYQATYFIYDLLGLLLFPLMALLMRDKKIRILHGWRALLIPYIIAVICYVWLPACGPLYGVENYPFGLGPQDIKVQLVSPSFAPRNAMPSLHLSTAVWFLMLIAALRRKRLFAVSGLFILGTAWATLALGEHYVIDLVVALPFSAALGVWLISPPNWRNDDRGRQVQWVAAATFVTWMLMLRLAPEWLAGNLGFVRAFSVWSIVVACWLLGRYLRCVSFNALQDSAQSVPESEWKIPYFLPNELRGNRWLVGIFFFSGFAGLVYEVVYAKALGVTFGGTALAANTVLMTYMGGMALGAWLGGILAERSRQPLLLYAMFEAAVGLYAVITPFLFSGIQTLYVAVATDSPPDAAWLTVLRMGLGAAVLGLPTVLMGATLPLVFQCLRMLGIPTARAIAPLYGANVLGAAVGSLVAGYALLPAVGRNGGTLLAAVMSLMVALYVIEKIKDGLAQFSTSATDSENVANTANTTEIKQIPHISVTICQGVGALAVLAVGGVVTLALEVVFMHLLAVVAGNSVYAFGLMLATFLAGLGLGSGVGERLMLQIERTRLITLAQCGIALSILLTAFVWDGLADYMGSFAYIQSQGLHLTFSARELVRALVCALAMMPPAFFIGMSYPAAMGVAADWLAVARFNGTVARGIGLASAVNTLGNIAGVLLAGFWLLPSFGSRNVLLGLAVVAVLLAGLMVWVGTLVGSVTERLSHWLPVGAMAVALVFFPSQWNYTALSRGGNVYFYPQAWGDVIDHAESVEGGLTTVTRAPGKGLLTLLTNGKFQGNNAEGGEMVAQESFALIPLLHTTRRDRALVIGYGTGMTARVLQAQGFNSLDVAELSSDIVEMADKYFENINAHISRHPSVNMFYTDGRNYLLTQSQQYDLISLEITSIWFAGAANLYNHEFYKLANQRLRPQGVLQQWVQLHHMRPVDFLYILGSVRSVFNKVWIYMSGGQGIIVATNSDVEKKTEEALTKLLRNKIISDIKLESLPKSLLAGPEKIDALLKCYDPALRFLVSTDKNLYLEYATPKGNAILGDSAPVLIDMLSNFQTCPMK